MSKPVGGRREPLEKEYSAGLWISGLSVQEIDTVNGGGVNGVRGLDSRLGTFKRHFD